MKTIKEKLDQIEEMKSRGREKHGDDFYDHPIYNELLEKELALRRELMKPEKASDKEWDTEW